MTMTTKMKMTGLIRIPVRWFTLLLFLLILLVVKGGEAVESHPQHNDEETALRQQPDDNAQPPFDFRQRLSGTNTTDASNDSIKSRASCLGSPDPLSCWLSRILVVPLADQEFTAGFLTVRLDNLICEHFELANVTTKSIAAERNKRTTLNTGIKSDPSLPGLAISIGQVAAECKGTYTVLTSSSHTADVNSAIDDHHHNLESVGHIQARVQGGGYWNSSDDSSSDSDDIIAMILNVQIESSPNQTATDSDDDDPIAKPVAVHTHITVPSQTAWYTDVHIIDGSAKILNLFRQPIGRYLCRQLVHELETDASKYADPWMTRQLQAAIRLLDQYITNATTGGISTAVTVAAREDKVMKSMPRGHSEENTTSTLSSFLTGNHHHKRRPAAHTTIPPAISSTNHLLARVNEELLRNHLNRSLLFPWNDWFSNATTIAQCGGISGGLNGILGSLLLQPSGLSESQEETQTTNGRDDSFTIPLTSTMITLVNATIGSSSSSTLASTTIVHVYLSNRSSISVGPVDKWEQLTIMRPDYDDFARTDDGTCSFGRQAALSSHYTTHIRTPRLSVTLHNVTLVVTQPIAADNQNSTPSLTEFFDVSLTVESLELLARLVIDWAGHGSETDSSGVTIATILQALNLGANTTANATRMARDCLFSQVRNVSLAQLEITRGFVWSNLSVTPLVNQQQSRRRRRRSEKPIYQENKPLSASSLETDLDYLINAMVSLVLDTYPTYISRVLQGILRGPGLYYANSWFNDSLVSFHRSSNHSCQQAAAATNDFPRVLDFGESHFWKHVTGFLQQPNSRQRWNDYLDCTATAVANEVLEGFVNKSRPLLQLNAFRLEGVGNVGRFRLLEPVGNEGTHLWSSFDYNRSVVEENDTNVAVQDNGNRVPRLVTDATSPPRLFTSFTLFPEHPATSSAWNVSLVVNGVHLTAGAIVRYDLHYLGELTVAKALQQSACWLAPINEFDLYNVTSALSTMTIKVKGVMASGKPVMLDYSGQEMSAAVLDWAMHTGRDGLKLVSLSLLDQASAVCEGEFIPSRDDGDDNIPNYTSILLVVAACFLLAQPILLLLRPSTSLRVVSSTEPDSLTEPLLVTDRGTDDEDRSLPEESTSLMYKAPVSEILQVGLPIAILCTMAMLLASNLSTGAAVDLNFSVNGKLSSLPSIFSFSLANTAHDMWHAKIYPLFFLVVVFSGAWPYVKLGLMLASWLTAESTLSVATRGRLLFLLDALGKFSLVDTYVLVLMIVAFRYHLDLVDAIILDVFVTPGFGFYGFLAATSLSLVLGHTLVYCHRRSVVEAQGVQLSDEPFERLGDHPFRIGAGETSRLSRAFQLSCLAVSIGTATCLAIGMTQKSFEFEIGGAATMINGERSTDHVYSLISLGLALPNSVSANSQVGIRALQAIYFFCAVAPFLCLALLAVLFLVPMSLRSQFICVTLAEVANAWSAVEVFALSIVAALFEISTFASFIVGSKCDRVNTVLGDLFDEEGIQCYTVMSNVRWNAVYLILGALLNSVVVSFAFKLAHSAMCERTGEATHDTRGVAESLFSSKFTKWVFRSRDLTDVGPPVNADFAPDLASQDNNLDTLQNQWNGLTETNPDWKRWKEATSVT